MLINMQAGTVMHELGHNLGLLHGGNVSTNYKPNYWSVMNYLYQLEGLDASASAATAYLRWRLNQNNNGCGTTVNCTYPNKNTGSPSQFIIDYSNGSGGDLIESELYEVLNIGRGATGGAYADWNLNGNVTSTPLSLDLNNDGRYDTLRDYDDWSNLVFPFQSSSHASGVSFKKSSSTRSTAAVPNPVTRDRQPFTPEESPPARVFEQIKNAR